MKGLYTKTIIKLRKNHMPVLLLEDKKGTGQLSLEQLGTIF